MVAVNSTDEYWDVDGVSLNQLTQNLVSVGGDRMSVPDLRGDNRVVPYLPGELWVPKVPGPRDIVLKGWMADPDPLMLRTRWRQFMGLLWRPNEQFKLTKRWYDSLGVLQTATGYAEYRSGMVPDVTARSTRLEFEVTIRIASGFFNGNIPVVVPLSVGDTIHHAQGVYPTNKITVTLVGPLTNARITPKTIGQVADNTLTYSSLAAGATAVINVETFRATEGNGSVKTSGKVSHTGRAAWLYLPLKLDTIAFARDAGTGTASLQYTPLFH